MTPRNGDDDDWALAPKRACYHPAAMPLVLRRVTWNGTPVELDHLFQLHRQREEKRFDAICRLMSHQFGWELRLHVNGELRWSQVCHSQDEVLDTCEAWKAAMIDSGWHLP